MQDTSQYDSISSMTKVAENNLAAHYDAEASKFLQRAGSWANLSDSAESGKKEKYWALAQECFAKAGEALESAKRAAQG